MTSCHTSKWIIAQNLEHFRKLSFIFHLRFKIIFIAYMHSHSTFKVHQVELETLILKESHSLFFPHYPTILQLQLQHPHSFDNWLCPGLDGWCCLGPGVQLHGRHPAWAKLLFKVYWWEIAGAMHWNGNWNENDLLMTHLLDNAWIICT